MDSGEPGFVTGGVRLVLRAEGAALLGVATFAYALSGANWWLYAALFLAPDLAFLGYLAGRRAGALAYNLLHSTAGPLLLGGLGLMRPETPVIAIAAIWLAHIGLDRMLGYGLKFSAGFGYTHLGRLGRSERPA
jgi:hypothetical protein